MTSPLPHQVPCCCPKMLLSPTRKRFLLSKMHHVLAGTQSQRRWRTSVLPHICGGVPIHTSTLLHIGSTFASCILSSRRSTLA